MRLCTSILVVFGLALAGPLPIGPDCAAQPSCSCPHEAPTGPTPGVDTPSGCCDTADATPPAPAEPITRELPLRSSPQTALARPSTDQAEVGPSARAPRRPRSEIAETHRHARLSVFLI